MQNTDSNWSDWSVAGVAIAGALVGFTARAFLSSSQRQHGHLVQSNSGGAGAGPSPGAATNDDTKRSFQNGDDSDEWEEIDEADIDPSQRMKMVVCIRTDLKMKKGKMCSQVGHAAAGACVDALCRTPQLFHQYARQGQKKVVTKVKSKEQL
jgi:Peptidyl-tRNA hydrolase PTH2